MKPLFLLDPGVVYLNHGSYGATPRPVLDAYQEWQRRLEREPVRFLQHELPGHLAAARAVLAGYLGARADDLVYVPNATFAVNVIARSLPLAAGDEVLATDHEYGAMDKVWRFVCARRGAAYRRQGLPFGDAERRLSESERIEAFWSGVTPYTRVIFLSHITSPTALTLPVAAICARAREAGILTVIDGAHAPGQIALDLSRLGADFYVGNCHKWLCAPKGAGFLWARRERQHLIEPLVVGWGWGADRPWSFGSDFLDALQFLGTNDFSAYLAVPDAIRFQAAHDWPSQQARCHRLLRAALDGIGAITGLPSPYSSAGDYHQMAVASLPSGTDTARLHARLFDEHRIEIPCILWRDRRFIRVSVQVYNTEGDIDALLTALRAVL